MPDPAYERRILYVQYTNPAAYPPLEHNSQILANTGWQVLFLGTDALGASVLRFPQHENIRVLQMPFRSAGWRQKVHYLQFCLWVIGWTLRWRPQWVYASDLLSCPIGWLLSYLPGVQAIYHEHDMPFQSTGSVFIRLCLAARKAIANHVRLCIVPNQQRAQKFVEDTATLTNVLYVWNCPSVDEVSPPRPVWQNDELWILYHGSIVPSRLQPTVLKALAVLPDYVKLRIIGYETVGYVGYIRQLKELACQLGINDRIEFLGTLPTRRDLLKWCQQSDVGIAFMPKSNGDFNEQHMTGASNKPFDYMACGLALLVSDLSDWREMYIEPGYGYACDPEDAESIARALRWFLEHPAKMRAMGEQGRQRIAAEWNYEKQFSPVLEFLAGKMF
jgi:glycosyltransferase involved in cell wall biosynthesis